MGENRQGIEKDLSQILIGSSHVVNSIFDDEQTALYSIDNLRFGLKIPKGNYDKFCDLNDTLVTPNGGYSTSDRRLAAFRTRWTHEYEESSISVGIGWNNPGGAVDETKGYVEFNPNKVGEAGRSLLSRLRRANVTTEIKRYDLAIDIPVNRDEVRLMRDTRNYEFYSGRSMTEYLGQRSKVGYVKVYDKTAEAELAFPLTRIELTCGGDWSIDAVRKHLPVCYSFGNREFEELARTTKIVALMTRYIEAEGGIAEPWLRMMNSHTRAKVKSALSQEVVVRYSDACIGGIIEQVREWESA